MWLHGASRRPDSGDQRARPIHPEIRWRRAEARDTATGEVEWTRRRDNLVFGSNSELRAVAEVYGARPGRQL